MLIDYMDNDFCKKRGKKRGKGFNLDFNSMSG